MQWNDIQKDWKALSKNFNAKWSKLTDADLNTIAGKRDVLVESLCERYDKDAAKVEKEIDEFVKTLKSVKA